MSTCPPDFKPVVGVKYAEFSDTAPEFLVNRKGLKGARLQGVKYETRALEMLRDRYEERFIAAPWIKYRTNSDGRLMWCQPDGLLVEVREGKLVVVEVKYRHTAMAWWQLFMLYQPILQFMFPAQHWTYGMVEVCKWFDPATSVPMKPVMRERVADAVPGQFSVHIWRP